MTAQSRAIARKRIAQAVISSRRRQHPGVPYWRWRSQDGVTLHVFDEAAGIPWSSVCGLARYSLRWVSGGSPCITCRERMGGGVLED